MFLGKHADLTEKIIGAFYKVLDFGKIRAGEVVDWKK